MRVKSKRKDEPSECENVQPSESVYNVVCVWQGLGEEGLRHNKFCKAVYFLRILKNFLG